MAPDRTRVAATLLLVGLLLVPGPAYAIGLERLDGPERDRVSTGYRATPIDLGDDATLADDYGIRLAFQPEDLSYGHVAADYRAPNATRDALDRALREGHVAVRDPAVRADVRAIDRNYSFLTREFDDYHAFTLKDGVLRTERADESAVAAVVRDELTVAYADLPPEERETFRKVRDATRREESYRPWRDEPVPEAPIVTREGNGDGDGQAYALEAYSQTDDIDFPDGLLLGIAGSAAGVLSILSGLALWLFDVLSG
jgi:hypothetical protein